MTHAGGNLDPHELDKFSQGPEVWWDTQGEFRTLHAINPLRLRYIRDRIDLGMLDVIDVGCGGGILAEGLARHARHVTGIDLNATAIEAARTHNTHDNLEYACISTTEQAQGGQQYDVVTCMELLEHVPDPVALLADCKTLVKPGGQLFFSTISRNLSAYLKLVLAGEYLLGMLPRGTHDYSKFIKPSELARWCRECGLVVCDISGMEFSPLKQDFYLSQNPRTNYLLHAVAA